MNSLSNELLVEAYLKAVELGLDSAFISLLWCELSSRKIYL
ncbi:MAG: sporulation histidine kinase inhibitor Sda [Amphibacillus sp.]|uniref:Sporulation histidine kinase inhibitor Sda n=1 Tax=Amphibacillus xylanus (strain ATCC 51415 / DSM 6626 / JCM 7361 / LMG 17667 / NBRC 15112 / Ep01) TaxID=698758 RepID=K0J3Q8_AMPXN|nr:sporulation histidine kinase inhibitor Sda [Amphibacillus xylanus]NMA89790.1 sporulation histidine kinase inhibitor Sda [Amphibacillus sp.]BAM47797.1 hypothetical protein AXY_16650 [Amphibacillus xylanus NBRC 15112]